MNIAKMAKAAGLPTPKVLAVSSPDRRVWIVEVGSFTDRAKAEAARRKIATSDAQVVRSRVPVPRR
jgi:cell division protein FtsN